VHDISFKGNVECAQAPTPQGQGTSICKGLTATISASGCTTGYTAKWFTDANVTTVAPGTNSGNNYTTPVLTTTTDYYVACVKNDDATCKSIGVKITATVNNGPNLPSLPDDNICPNTTLTFGYQGLSNITYLWSTGATAASITVTPTQTTQYTVAVTSNSTGCSSKDTVTVTVDPKPNAGTDKVVCVPTATVAPAGSDETWSFFSFNDPNNAGNTDVATIDNQGNVASLDKTGFYRFILTNNKGCKDTIRIQRRIVTLPNINLNPICPGTSRSNLLPY